MQGMWRRTLAIIIRFLVEHLYNQHFSSSYERAKWTGIKLAGQIGQAY